MSYSGGRYSVYVDLETAKESYVTATFDAMTQPLVTWLNSLFGMVTFNDLTEATDKGHRYYIGYSGAEFPSFVIGWAAGNTNTRYFYLFIVGMYEGAPLDAILDSSGNGTLTNGQFRKLLIVRDFESTVYDYVYVKYIKDTNLVGISACYGSSSPVVTSANTIDFMVFKTDTKSLISYRNSNLYQTYDFTNDGVLTTLNPASTNFVNLKNIIANTDFNYICQVRLPHYVTVLDLFLYSVALTINSIYKINGEYYICLTTNANDGSYMAKLPTYEV